MSQTRAQRKKQQKSKSRENRIKRLRNIQRNSADKRYRLDVELEGTWRVGVKSWVHPWQVTAHKNETETRRSKGEEIVPGRIVDLKTGKVVLDIVGSKMKGSAPDKIADGPKTA